MAHTIRMNYERSTKGTHVFTETIEGSGCRTLYLNKNFFGDKPPKLIDVDITEIPGEEITDGNVL